MSAVTHPRQRSDFDGTWYARDDWLMLRWDESDSEQVDSYVQKYRHPDDAKAAARDLTKTGRAHNAAYYENERRRRGR